MNADQIVQSINQRIEDGQTVKLVVKSYGRDREIWVDGAELSGKTVVIYDAAGNSPAYVSEADAVAAYEARYGKVVARGSHYYR